MTCIAAARAQTSFTHGDPAVVEAAEFFARVTLAVQDGTAIPDALRVGRRARRMERHPGGLVRRRPRTPAPPPRPTPPPRRHTDSPATSRKPFPPICHLLLRHPDDVVTALTANVEAGGDSAARGMIIGMIYGAKPNATPLPEDWLSGLRALRRNRTTHRNQSTSHA